MNNSQDVAKPYTLSRIIKIFTKRERRRTETIIFRGLLHARVNHVLVFPYPNSRIDREEILIGKLNARLYRNFLVVDGQFMIKAYFTAHDDILRLEQMQGDFLTTLDLPGLQPGMKIEFGEITPDYFFALSAKEINQTSFNNEVVLEIPYLVTARNDFQERPE